MAKRNTRWFRVSRPEPAGQCLFFQFNNIKNTIAGSGLRPGTHYPSVSQRATLQINLVLVLV